ncbi:hypothetical protein PMAYCL1PPCAC_27055 [Pristionchus mayeri]|uniref:AMP-binding protein n=1 Tax=Pristionchus mayeri TaxID=1317129 RepID=A0AAN5D741_9BILA|nr:hypothetical protein PMAYCL1PPCAC_27055 [Pristionchus mayeri]
MMISHWQHEIYPVLCGGEFDWYEENQVTVAACYHIVAFTDVNWFLITGSPAVLMTSFDGDVYRNVVEKYKPRFFAVNPAIFAFLAKDPGGRKTPLSSVQMIMCGTAPLSQELSDQFLAAHPNVKYIVRGYGMTEIDYSHLPLLLEEGVNASAGVVASFFEQKIVNPDNIAPCKPGERGELWVRGAAQTIGYLNKPEATKDLIDEQGWIHTGDIGYIDNRGLLYIVDRIKELIKVNYNNTTNRVPPAELEGVLLSNNKIRDAAIVGIPDIKYGKLVRAFVVKADEKLMEEEVEEFIADKLAEFKRITGGVVFVDAIPRSPAGKILRRVLKEVHGA